MLIDTRARNYNTALKLRKNKLSIDFFQDAKNNVSNWLKSK